MRKILLICVVVAIALFLLGVFQYYMIGEDDDQIGNYLMSISSAIFCIAGFAFYVEKTKKLFGVDGDVISKVLLLVFPIFGAYMLFMGVGMICNITDMWLNGYSFSYSIVEEWISTTNYLFVTVGYLSALVVIEAVIVILLILKPSNK